MTVLAVEELMDSSSRLSVTTSTNSSSTSTPGPKRSPPPAPSRSGSQGSTPPAAVRTCGSGLHHRYRGANCTEARHDDGSVPQHPAGCGARRVPVSAATSETAASKPPRWTDLSRRQRRHAVIGMMISVTLAWALLFGIYYLIPFTDLTGAQSLVRLVLGIALFAGAPRAGSYAR